MNSYSKRPLKIGAQQGFTLIELMVGLLIGLLLLAATTSIFQTAARFRNTVVNQTLLQEESFFVSHTLRQQLAQVSYRHMDLDKLDVRLIPVAHEVDAFPKIEGVWVAGQSLKIDGTSLSYRYQGASDLIGNPDGSIYNCLGETVGFGDAEDTRLSLEDNQLVCTVGATKAVLAGDPDGVVIERLVYEMSVDEDGDRRIDKVIAPELATADDFVNTLSLTIKMLFATPDGVLKESQDYRFNGVDLQATDLRLRMATVVSVAIRN